MSKGLQKWSFALMLSFLTACNSTGTRPEYVAPDPKAAEINMRLGLNYMQRGDYAVALEKLQKALKQNPNLPSATTPLHCFISNWARPTRLKAIFWRRLSGRRIILRLRIISVFFSVIRVAMTMPKPGL